MPCQDGGPLALAQLAPGISPQVISSPAARCLAVLQRIDAVVMELDLMAILVLLLGSFVQKVQTCLYFPLSLWSALYLLRHR
jgi:hypothetical protein